VNRGNGTTHASESMGPMNGFSRRTIVRASLGCCTLGLLLVAGAAHAQTPVVDDFGALRTHERGTQIHSPQNMAIEIRVGRYHPDVDDEFSNSTPYKDMFGTDNRYAVGLEVDWQLLRIPYVGTLGPGLGLEYTKSSAAAIDAATRERAGEDTALIIFPLYAVAVLRADYIARQTPIPLVPYVKAGVGGAIWRVTNGGGTAYVGSSVGRGLSYGPQFALGAMLLLDVLDLEHARELDNEIGINHSYFFAEWYVSKLNAFGAGNQMQVGTNTWVLGLTFEI
jgi:hypothetical protein